MLLTEEEIKRIREEMGIVPGRPQRRYSSRKPSYKYLKAPGTNLMLGDTFKLGQRTYKVEEKDGTIGVQTRHWGFVKIADFLEGMKVKID